MMLGLSPRVQEKFHLRCWCDIVKIPSGSFFGSVLDAVTAFVYNGENFFGIVPVCAIKDKHATTDASFSMNKEKIQRLEQFSRQQLSRTYSFCFGSDEIIHQVSNDGQARSAYYKDFQDDVYKPLVVADENTNTQQKSSKLGPVFAAPIAAYLFSSLRTS